MMNEYGITQFYTIAVENQPMSSESRLYPRIARRKESQPLYLDTHAGQAIQPHFKVPQVVIET
jgi:hypothetical protein